MENLQQIKGTEKLSQSLILHHCELIPWNQHKTKYIESRIPSSMQEETCYLFYSTVKQGVSLTIFYI